LFIDPRKRICEKDRLTVIDTLDNVVGHIRDNHASGSED
jgi:hypothetical protein